ncbi:hypothetical protein PHMEG_00020224 [Phytophthora megakarya]|uniref:Uncharacterized protein n=1 Tax=Phytophthora megakarya TaxID=4795 RepID=A0A225VR61_9STRA|nr:hypothetical protein PHMEG_00020224 [Phytophthora megakarya]
MDPGLNDCWLAELLPGEMVMLLPDPESDFHEWDIELAWEAEVEPELGPELEFALLVELVELVLLVVLALPVLLLAVEALLVFELVLLGAVVLSALLDDAPESVTDLPSLVNVPSELT